MKSAKIILVVLIVLGVLTPSQSAYADIAPPPAPELGGLEPFGYQETNVQMVYERVEMEIQPVTKFEDDYVYSVSSVVVNAYFTMHNLGDMAETMQAIFPLESFSSCIGQNETANSYTEYSIQEESFSVTVEGAPVPVRKVITDHPYKDLVAIANMCEKMTWAGFDVTFPVDEDVVIKVQYVMETIMSADSIQNIHYILETGAGWAGSIQQAYVIVKFPYTATTENVLPESTPGYQFLYNEVFWSFQNLEPTSENNIQVSIVSPEIWQKIVSIRRELKESPKLPENWLELADIYFGIATWHWDNVRSDAYLQKIPSVYETGIAANPDNAQLYAKYAEFKLYEWSPRAMGQISESQARPILYLLNKALSLDPKNGTALDVLSQLRHAGPFIQFTPPCSPASHANISVYRGPLANAFSDNDAHPQREAGDGYSGSHKACVRSHLNLPAEANRDQLPCCYGRPR